MAANRYDQAAEMPIINTYVPIDFGNLYRIGATQKAAMDQAIADVSAAIQTFGEFRSPSRVDTENYYNMTIGQMSDLINQAATDPDRMRDAGFRAQFYNRLNSLNYAGLSQLKESAENLRAGLEMRAKMEAAGKYNENWDDADIAGYDTLRTGRVFEDITPVEYMNANQLSNAYFDNLKAGTIGSTWRDGVKYTVTGNTVEDLEAVADAHMNDLIATPQGRMYMRDFLRKNNGDETKAIEDFRDMIVASQMDRTLRPTLTVDPAWLSMVRASRSSGSQDADNPLLKRLQLINEGLNNRTDQNYKELFSPSEQAESQMATARMVQNLVDAQRQYQSNPSPQLEARIQDLQQTIELMSFGQLREANKRKALQQFTQHSEIKSTQDAQKDPLYSDENYLKGVNAALKAVSTNYSIIPQDMLLTQVGGTYQEVVDENGRLKGVYNYATSNGFVLPETVFNGITGSTPRELKRVGSSVFRNNDLLFQAQLEGGNLHGIEFEPQSEILRLGSGYKAVKGVARIPVDELERVLGTGSIARGAALFRQGRLDMSLKDRYGAREITRTINGKDQDFMEFDIYRVLAPEDGTAPESNTAANTMWGNSPTHGGIGSSTLANDLYPQSSIQSVTR